MPLPETPFHEPPSTLRLCYCVPSWYKPNHSIWIVKRLWRVHLIIGDTDLAHSRQSEASLSAHVGQGQECPINPHTLMTIHDYMYELLGHFSFYKLPVPSSQTMMTPIPQHDVCRTLYRWSFPATFRNLNSTLAIYVQWASSVSDKPRVPSAAR